jgi:poly(U)-specific endoribonuclease
MKVRVLLALTLVGLLRSCGALDFSNADIQKVVLALWNADANRATDSQIRLDYQDHTNGGDRVDNAPRNLFKSVDAALLRKPTYQALYDLFDAYASSSASTSSAGTKINAFLDKISATPVYATLQKFLADKGYEPAKNNADFRKAMSQIWFGDYGRSGSGQSSGFEHVFIGEVKNGQVSGLHNWVRMYYLEQKGKLDYTGFIIKRPRVAILQYKLGEAWKPTGSVLFGTSPEFDMAIFTLCFLGKQGESACKFFLGDCTPIDVSSYPYTVRGTVFIGTVYPSPWKTNDVCPMSG